MGYTVCDDNDHIDEVNFAHKVQLQLCDLDIEEKAVDPQPVSEPVNKATLPEGQEHYTASRALSTPFTLPEQESDSRRAVLQCRERQRKSIKRSREGEDQLVPRLWKCPLSFD